MKIRRIISDLSADSVDVQILALSTIPRLSCGMKASVEAIESLKQAVEIVSQGGNSDITFLARKALNHLAGFANAPVNDTPIEDIAGTVSPAVPVETAVPVESAAAVEPVALVEPTVADVASGKTDSASPRPVGLDISGSGAPAVDDGDDEFAATVIRDVSASETFDIERQLVKEEDPRRIATLLATLATDATDVFVLNRVVGFLEHENDRVRANAVEVFEKLGSGDVHMSFLTPMLKDSNNRVRSNVIKAIGKFGHPQVKLFLSEMLESSEVSMRESGVYALCELRSLEVMDLLIKMLEDPYVDIRIRILKALAAFDLPEVIEAIKKRVCDDDEVVRQHAFAVLEAKGVDVEKLVSEAAAAAKNNIDQDFSDMSEAVDDSSSPVLDEAVVAPEKAEPPADEAVVAPEKAEPPVAKAVVAPEKAEPPVAKAVAVPEKPEPSVAKDTVDSDAAKATADDKRFRNILQAIHRELRQREQRARFSRLLFTVGTTVYELCKKSILKDVSFLAVFYEVVKYQEYVLQLATKLALEGKDSPNVTILKSGIDQYSSKIRDCFIKLGKEAAKEYKAGKIKLPESKELTSVLKMLK